MGILGRRWIVWTLLALGVAALLALALWPRAEEVEVAVVERGAMRVTVQDEGRTRVRELYSVAAPVAGELDRIDLEAGDRVTAGETVVARIRPMESPFLDPRSEAAAAARLEAARAAVDLAQAELRRAEAERDYASQELQRARRLAERGNISESRLDQAESRMRSARADVAAAEAALRLRREELDEARAQLTQPSPRAHSPGSSCCITVTAPVSGEVLQVLRKSAGPVVEGAELLTIGDASELEVVVDLLSTDAVKVRPGAAVDVVGWGGEQPLKGTVRRVEPFGFTEVSALGIEEQRVNVIVDVDAAAARDAGLRHGFRVEPRITVWRGEDVLRLPLGALFRSADGHWAVFVSRDGRARLRNIEIGQTNSEVVEVPDGLEAGERVILFPSDRISEGTRIRPRG
ncbi:efflux RND transporter periplasmic adaptor subunit [Ferruginivarius sediminum]|uniref:HlyD family efflux transporter periplasmic adaptor subunit n=1 Tax=Ferruginivarius sediminum TaxID=2661937 RepID=A0A369TDN6_9PROT|nr:HlyD family efflux transporter periplasmic adaptor subunit [Ferruginivarius sediminum]RDD62952.1 HlyD family efflux transporter periplasmic adaptor subunit [Ferruginivarius sediminum]